MGEATRYNNENELFNESLRTLCRCVAELIHPANGRALAAGYYISAYAIAVKHGFEGDEQQWLASLGGTGAGVDAGLSKEGFAADAFVTGQKFGELKNGKGNLNINEARLNSFQVKNAVNGVNVYAETLDPKRPMMCLYGDIGDEAVALGNVATPCNDNEAANKAFVEGKVKNLPRMFLPGEDCSDAKDGDMRIREIEEDNEFATKADVKTAIEDAFRTLAIAEEGVY